MRRNAPLVLALFCGVACSDTASPETPQVEPSTTAQVPVVIPPQVAPELAPGPASEEDESGEVPTSDVPARARILFGDVYMIEGLGENADDVELPYTLLAKLPPQPQPASTVVGRIQVHHGQWNVRVIRELPSPFEHVSIIEGGEGGEVCEARVVRARELHAQEAAHSGGDEPPQDWTFLGLEFSGCDGGSLGVAGTAVTTHDLRREHMQTPATAELIALVRPHDDGVWEDPIPSADFRMLRLPRRGITVVAGSTAWLVRRGEVLEERFHGFPIVLVEAGPETFFEMSAPSENWAASLDDFLPPSASCLVADTSGTPLNVRDSPGSRAVIDTLENDTRVRIVESRGAWRRLEGRGQAWVHESGLRCQSLD